MRSETATKPPQRGLHRRPAGVTDETVEALGALSEALEWIERARGVLYEFHQLVGHADGVFEKAAGRFRTAGHPEAAERVEREIIGRNVLHGRWTFQVVEEFDDDFWSPVRAVEADLRAELGGNVRHLFEAEMKAERITPGDPAHRAVPDGG